MRTDIANLHQLRTTTPNPQHDGRTRYGAEAIKQLEPGTIVAITTGDSDERFPKVHVVGGCRHVGGPFAEAIATNSEPIEPGDWFQWSSTTEAGSLVEDQFSTRVLNKLWTAWPEFRWAIKQATAHECDR